MEKTIQARNSRDELGLKIARWISIIAHPFVMIAVMVAAATARLGAPGEIVGTVLLVAIFVIVPIGALTFWQVRRGAWANADASNSSERPLLYAVGIASVLALLGYLRTHHAGSFLIRGSAVTLAMLAGCAVATRWLKVSLHLAAASLTATALLLLGSPVGWGLVIIVPLLAWSRLTMGRHTPLEVASGLLFGVLAGVATHYI